MARKKLKEAEKFSDINSGTDLDEKSKKSRKFRAAKEMDESSYDDESDGIISSSKIPKFTQKAQDGKIIKIID